MSEHNDIPDDAKADVQAGGKDDGRDGGKGPDSPHPITRNRMIIWIIVGAFALYMIGTGVVGILTK